MQFSECISIPGGTELAETGTPWGDEREASQPTAEDTPQTVTQKDAGDSLSASLVKSVSALRRRRQLSKSCPSIAGSNLGAPLSTFPPLVVPPHLRIDSSRLQLTTQKIGEGSFGDVVLGILCDCPSAGGPVTGTKVPLLCRGAGGASTATVAAPSGNRELSVGMESGCAVYDSGESHGTTNSGSVAADHLYSRHGSQTLFSDRDDVPTMNLPLYLHSDLSHCTLQPPLNQVQHSVHPPSQSPSIVLPCRPAATGQASRCTLSPPFPVHERCTSDTTGVSSSSFSHMEQSGSYHSHSAEDVVAHHHSGKAALLPPLPEQRSVPETSGSSRRVAVKIINKAQITRKSYASIQNEINVIASLSHSSIINLHGVVERDSEIYLVMDVAEGGDILSYTKRFGIEDMCTMAPRLMADVVLGLQHMRERGGLIHRDLKPENLLLTWDFHVKIADFGTACRLDDAEANTFGGTAQYMSPEILTQGRASASSDLWALGCVVFQLLVGRPPFQGKTPYLMMQSIKNHTYGALEFPPYFPDAAKDLVNRLLDPNPRTRIGGSEEHGFAELQAHPFFANIDWDGIFEASNVTAANTDYSVMLGELLLPSEHMVYCSEVSKARYNFLPSSAKRRMLVLTDSPRLFYVHPSTRVVMGHIPWTPDLYAEVETQERFRVVTRCGGREYHFSDLSGSAGIWGSKINSMAKQCAQAPAACSRRSCCPPRLKCAAPSSARTSAQNCSSLCLSTCSAGATPTGSYQPGALGSWCSSRREDREAGLDIHNREDTDARVMKGTGPTPLARRPQLSKSPAPQGVGEGAEGHPTAGETTDTETSGSREASMTDRDWLSKLKATSSSLLVRCRRRR